MPEVIGLESKPCLARKARPERVVKLNPTGAAILRHCDGKQTVEEIVQHLEAEFAQANLTDDVLAFLRKVHEQGWVEP